ncbi:hypothetical protein Tco_0594372, partial [Tanacetum coccineum]
MEIKDKLDLDQNGSLVAWMTPRVCHLPNQRWKSAWETGKRLTSVN